MPSFEEALEAASLLARQWTNSKARLFAMGAAEDHDPTWNDARAAEADREQARFDELANEIGAALAAFERDHPVPWRAYLASTVTRLRAVKAANDVFSYEADSWERWLRGELPAPDRPEVFARGLDVMARNPES